MDQQPVSDVKERFKDRLFPSAAIEERADPAAADLTRQTRRADFRTLHSHNAGLRRSAAASSRIWRSTAANSRVRAAGFRRGTAAGSRRTFSWTRSTWSGHTAKGAADGSTATARLATTSTTSVSAIQCCGRTWTGRRGSRTRTAVCLHVAGTRSIPTKTPTARTAPSPATGWSCWCRWHAAATCCWIGVTVVANEALCSFGSRWGRCSTTTTAAV